MNASDLTTLVDSLPDSGPTLSIDVGFESSLTSDISRFENSLEMSAENAVSNEISGAAKVALEPLSRLNDEAAALADFASSAVADNANFTPSEIVSLTYKAQEFGFHSQLTANIANRVSDGVQQLFRQQG